MAVALRALQRNTEQKLANRQSILNAGLLTFKEKTYANTSVEDVLVQAGVSRATFYKHFSSKYALAEGLLDEMVRKQDLAYDRLSKVESPRLEDIVAWLTRVVEIFEENRTLLVVLEDLLATEPKLVDAVRVAHIDRIRKLTMSFTAFRDVFPRDDKDMIATQRAWLLMMEIDHILAGLAVGDWKFDRNLVIEFLADQIMHFLAGARIS